MTINDDVVVDGGDHDGDHEDDDKMTMTDDGDNDYDNMVIIKVPI